MSRERQELRFHYGLAQRSDLSVDEEIGLMNALAAVGRDARSASDLILKRLGHSSRSVGTAAKDALLKIGMDIASGRALLKLVMAEDTGAWPKRHVTGCCAWESQPSPR